MARRLNARAEQQQGNPMALVTGGLAQETMGKLRAVASPWNSKATYLARSYAATREVPSRLGQWAAGNRSSAGWERGKVGWDDHMEGQSTYADEPFPPASPASTAQPPGQPNTTTTTLRRLFCPCFSEGKECGVGGLRARGRRRSLPSLHQYSLLADKKCIRAWSKRPCSHSHPATRHQPRPSSPCGPRVTVSVPQR